MEYIDLKVVNDQLLILVAIVNTSEVETEVVSGDGMDTNNKMATLATGKLMCYQLTDSYLELFSCVDS